MSPSFSCSSNTTEKSDIKKPQDHTQAVTLEGYGLNIGAPGATLTGFIAAKV